VKYPLDTLEDVPVKLGDVCVLNNFIILDMAEDVSTQIILGRPFLAASSCKIDVTRRRLTFDVGECHVVFNLLEDQNVSLLHLLVMN